MKKVVLDTNIWIQYFNDSNPSVRELLILIKECNNDLILCYHQATEDDLRKDKCLERKNYQLKLTKIAECVKRLSIPSPEVNVFKIKNDNDRIDLEILDSLFCGKYEVLVTEDKELKRKAADIGLGAKVFSSNEFIQYCTKEFKIFEQQYVFPKIECQKGEEINHLLPFFDSLRSDYPEFDDWFKDKCAKRDCYVVLDNDEIAGIAILKGENEQKLKICTFKISEDFRGFKYGEALLRNIFEYAIGKNYNSVFLTAFEDKQSYLIHSFLLPFGFDIVKNSHNSIDYIKNPDTGENTTEITLENDFLTSDYPIVDSKFPSVVLIPIQPIWHKKLFPEYVPREEPTQLTFLHPSSCGYALSKTYICKAQTNSVQEGSLALFYLSGGCRSIISSAVIKSYIIADDFEHLCRLTRNKTVYTTKELLDIWGDGNSSIKIIVFRLICHFEPRIEWEKSTPQSLMNISKYTDVVEDILNHRSITRWLK
jgi:predicted nucleic acid-binding protein